MASIEEKRRDSRTIIARVDLKPAPFNETVFQLKASATQLVSIVVLVLYLLPLYSEGFAWWGEGARRFLGVSVMDFPRLRVHLALALEWPDFQLPRMSIQFAVGALLIVVQLLLRWGKKAVWHVAMHLHMDPQPGSMEKHVLRVLAWSSWTPARYPTEVVQAALGAVDWRNAVARLQAWRQGARQDGRNSAGASSSEAGAPTTSKVSSPRRLSVVARAAEEAASSGDTAAAPRTLSCLGATAGCSTLVKARRKTFSKNDGDVDVKAFTDIEEAMSFRRMECVDNLQVTGRALDMITFQCPWLVEVDFSGCKNVQGECRKKDENVKVRAVALLYIFAALRVCSLDMFFAFVFFVCSRPFKLCKPCQRTNHQPSRLHPY